MRTLRTMCLAAALLTPGLLPAADAEPPAQPSLSDAEEAWHRGDIAGALQQWRALAERGDIIAANNLGYLYETGRGVPRDYTEALRWYRVTAEAGAPIGQFNLGETYLEGRGVEADPVEAAKWFLLASWQGEPDSLEHVRKLKAELAPERFRDAYERALAWRRDKARSRQR